MTYQPQVGHYLHASCSDADVYEIIGVGRDDNEQPTIDVRVCDPHEVIHFEADLDDASGFGNPLTEIQCERLVFHNMLWKDWTKESDTFATVQVNGPEGGCFRCCYLLSVHTEPGGRSAYVMP